MAQPALQSVPAPKSRLDLTVALLGGKARLNRQVRSALEAHALLADGLPNSALSHLLDKLILLRLDDQLARVIGMSARTVQRHKSVPKDCLDREQSGRAWKFAEVLARATQVLGDQEQAERWMLAPALGLSGWQPLDLLATPAGLAMVEEHLDRLEYGVYV